MTATPDPAQLEADSQQIFEALAHGVAGDDETAWSLLQPIVRRSEPAMYATICALAESAAFDSIQRHGTGKFVLKIEDLVTGSHRSAAVLPPGLRFAVQFATAWANRQQNTAEALYLALYKTDPEALADGVRAIYEMAVVSLRGYVERKREAEGQ